MENTQQQPPQVISLADIANRSYQEPEQPLIEQSFTEQPVQETKLETSQELPVEEQKSTTRYAEKIKSLIEDGFLEDISITLDDKEVFLSDADIQDKDTYDNILENIKADKKKQREEKYISKDGLDDTFLKVVEARKAGANVNEIFQENISAIDQLSNLRYALDSVEVADNEKEQLAINIVAQNLQQKGLSQKVIQAQIEDYIDSGSLENEATSILNGHLQLHNQAIEQKTQIEFQRLEKEKEDFKVFKKTISSTYKEFGIPDSMQRVLVDNATKLDDLKISNTDKLYFETQQKNPDLFAKVNFLLNNPQEFEKWISGKKVTEAKKEIYRPSLVINSNKKRETSNRNISSLEEIATRQ